ncbi:hypothetical protein [Parvibaculum sp.]|jgi:hypothetical protein|uniref:hypothetical protein n=2 Tax=Parvibaculum sp. TaxID=2024848 RepID=UPI001B0FD124|nr:hypothetical protein [Parvibaculum sp.]MBO6634557.1 hypothetical protein [Parvibaculum sp.]MBO6679672.1 hypothetical protein [Parvibaculum sp.]MBO6906190.1 hypothetical protein [Parvibaculum sp.]
MSQAAENPLPPTPPIRTGAHWTIYLPSLVVALTWTVVYFWAIWQEPPLTAIRAVALAIESVVVPLLLVHAFLRARVLRAEISDGVLELTWGFPYRRHARLDIPGISLAQVRRSFAQRRFGGGALALIARDGERYLIADLAEPEAIAAAINNSNRKRDAA